MKRLLILLAAFGWLCSGIAYAQASDTLFISTSQTVHLRFSSELKYVGLGNRAIVAKIVDGSKDFVAVKAREPFDLCTSMSCLEANGTMHTFIVAYREHPLRLDIDTRAHSQPHPAAGQPQADFPFSASSSDPESPSDLSLSFEQIIAMKQELYHIGTRDYGIEILCENIFVNEDVLYLVMSVRNRSALSYEMASPRFAIESRKKTKRGLQYEKAIFPKNVYGLKNIQPDTTGKQVFAFEKITLTRGQVFRVYFYEKGGSRNFTLTLSPRDIHACGVTL